MSARALGLSISAALVVAGCGSYEALSLRTVAHAGGPLPAGPIEDREACERLAGGAPESGEILWCQAAEAPKPGTSAVATLECVSPGGSFTRGLPEQEIAQLGSFGPEECGRACAGPGQPPRERMTCRLGPRAAPTGQRLVVAVKNTHQKKWNPFDGLNLVRTWQGRRPASCAARPRRRDGAGARFAEAAALEAASVVAFVDLERELAALGAPPRLIARVRRARADEERHTAAMDGLAERFGARGGRLACSPLAAPRDRLAVAIDNAVEGCVGETFAAALAEHQARSSADPVVRRALRAVARDELRHAALAWDVHGWLLPRLDPAERVEVAEAVARALPGRRAAAGEPLSSELASLGFLGGERGAQLFAALSASLFHRLRSNEGLSPGSSRAESRRSSVARPRRSASERRPGRGSVG